MSIKQISILAISLLIISCSSNKTEEKDHSHDDHAHHQHEQTEGQAKPKSPRMAAMANIGDNHVHIDYSAPSVRGRQIFGGLVAYGDVWVTGAHSATSISFSKDVLLEGQLIPKGKYALFTIPGEEEWVVIINSNWDMHLADDYDVKEDIMRITLKPEVLESPVEQLLFEVEETEKGKGIIRFRWSDRGFSLGVTLP